MTTQPLVDAPTQRSRAFPAAALSERLRAALHSDAAGRLTRRARYLATRVAVGVDDDLTLLAIGDGGLTVHQALPPLCSWDFSIKGTAAAWTAYWAPIPAPGWHDLFALAKRGEIRFEGDLLPFLTHLQFFKDLLARPREGVG